MFIDTLTTTAEYKMLTGKYSFIPQNTVFSDTFTSIAQSITFTDTFSSTT